MSSTVIFQIQSFLIVAIMLLGVYHRRNRKLHVKLMSTTIIWDILLILQIEVSRSAIATASKVMTNPLMLKIHLFFAVGSVLLYFFLIYSGRKLLKNENDIRPKHKVVGMTTVVFRIMTLVTSFWAAQK